MNLNLDFTRSAFIAWFIMLVHKVAIYRTACTVPDTFFHTESNSLHYSNVLPQHSLRSNPQLPTLNVRLLTPTEIEFIILLYYKTPEDQKDKLTSFESCSYKFWTKKMDDRFLSLTISVSFLFPFLSGSKANLIFTY